MKDVIKVGVKVVPELLAMGFRATRDLVKRRRNLGTGEAPVTTHEVRDSLSRDALEQRQRDLIRERFGE